MTLTPQRFTLEQANGVLPQLESLFVCFLKGRSTAERLHDELLFKELVLHTEMDNRGPESFLSLDQEAKEIDLFVEQLQEEVQRILSLGCVIRNLKQGWVDFPGEKDGEEIYFCWRRGEESIRYYHPRAGNITQRLLL